MLARALKVASLESPKLVPVIVVTMLGTRTPAMVVQGAIVAVSTQYAVTLAAMVSSVHRVVSPVEPFVDPPVKVPK